MPSDNSRTDAESWPVDGHDWAVRLLQQAIPTNEKGVQAERSTLRHAYLLLGPQQVGKTTLARTLSQALLCAGHAKRPCGNCRACSLFAHGNHPDFRFIQPLNKDGEVDREGGMLRAEQASDIIHDVATAPIDGRYKVFLIQDFHRAHPSFANRLLKTLEEPPGYVILCLTATDRASLLPTIVSRCQVLELRPIEPNTVAQALVSKWQASPETASLLARLCSGRLGWAVNQLEHPEGMQQRQSALETLRELVEADRVARLAFAEGLAKNRNNQRLFGLLELWTTWWRDVLLIQSGCAEACSNIDCMPWLETHAKQVPGESVRAYMRTLKRIEGYLHHTVNTRLALDVLLLELPVAGR